MRSLFLMLATVVAAFAAPEAPSIERLDPAFDNLVAPGTPVEVLGRPGLFQKPLFP